MPNLPKHDLSAGVIDQGPLQATIQGVLDAVYSEPTRRAYERALKDFTEWYDEMGPLRPVTVSG